MSNDTQQVVSVAGAAMILIAYAAQRFRFLSPDGALYLFLNFAGATLLCVIAFITWQIGFIVVEGMWALLSLAGLVMPGACRKEANRG